MEQPHRKRVVHFDLPGHVHELTFSCYQRLPLLTNDEWRSMLAESVQRAIVRHHYRLIAFVFMPEHVHLLVFPEREAAPISSLLTAIKRPFSYRMKQLLIAAKSDLLSRLMISQRPGVVSFRFWLEGPGYDRNLTEPKAIEASIDYIHNNPVKRGLCERAIDWRWSSARSFILPDQPVDPLLPKLSPLLFDDSHTDP